MAREFSSGGRGKGRGTSKKSDKGKSGWVKPDGTPLRARKGDYFPDKEINDRKKPRPFTSRDGDSRPRRDENAGERKPYARRDESSTDRKPFVRRDDDRGERKPYARRDDNSSTDRKPFVRRDDDRGERKPYARRDDSSTDRKPFVKRDDDRGERKPYARRDESSSDRKPFVRRDDDRGERKPYARRDDSSTDRKPFVKRDDDRGERKPYARRDDNSSTDRKPFVRRDDDRGERKPYARRDDSSSDRKPFVRRDDDRGERKPYARRDDSSTDRKPFIKRDDDRGERKPYARRDDNSSDRKPYVKRDDDRGERKPYARRDDEGGESKPYSSRDENSTSRPYEKRTGSYRDYKDKGRETESGDREERSSDRPSRPYNATGRSGKKPFEKKRERYADRDHSKEMRGRFDKDRGSKSRSEKPSGTRKKSSFTPDDNGSIRLNRYISNAGICSRREADELIVAGVISINGEIVTELGTKVNAGDVVKYHDQTLKTEKHVYVLLNKPKDYITTTEDPDERKTVMALVHDACKERIFPVGRLDRNTTGLLLLTNDGELTKRLTHPSGEIKKLYQVELDRNLTQGDMLRAAEGVELEDGIASFDEIQYVSTDDKTIIGVELHSGKNRIVRRIFEAMDYKVRKLDRTTFAGLTKKDLPRGRWRFLTEMEVNMLKMLTGKKRKAAAEMDLEE
ncbi:MAG: pseudouridine synthase [Bacteroidia bacterium]|nr:pseudouridine synthase [Bacteroidia bacterium]